MLKAMHVSELYGVLDSDTRDWTDGLLSHLFRELNRPLISNERKEQRYLVFDGDVDAVWVENMNSVMDDNKLLTLPNGERIRLQDHCKLLFEVSDLQYASPATISRCGMVYVDSRNLGYEPYIYSWVLKRNYNDYVNNILNELFNKYIKYCVNWIIYGIDDKDEFVSVKPRQMIIMSDLHMVKQLCTLLEAHLTLINDDFNIIEAIFIFCIIWSFGACLIQNNKDICDRDRFDAFIKHLSGFGIKDDDKVISTMLPKDSLYNYCFDIQEKHWMHWKSYIFASSSITNNNGGHLLHHQPPFNTFNFMTNKDKAIIMNVNKQASTSNLIVPTADTMRSTYLIDIIMKHNGHCLFVGESGTAKTVTIQHYLNNLPTDQHMVLNMNFSSRTSSSDVQSIIYDALEKKKKDTYAPPNNKKLNLFIDDLNMPYVDKYGTQMPIALLKLFLERKGMYQQKQHNWIHVNNVQMIGAMKTKSSSTGTGCQGRGDGMMDPRFLSMFNVFNIEAPCDDNLKTIYNTMLSSNHLNAFSSIATTTTNCIDDVYHNITDVTLDIYNYLIKVLPPTPSKFHYIFNLRDLSRIYEGLLHTIINNSYNNNCISTNNGDNNSTTTTTTNTTFVVKKDFIIKIWKNECFRIFHDRLIDQKDKDIFIHKFNEKISTYPQILNECHDNDDTLITSNINSISLSNLNNFGKDDDTLKNIYEKYLIEYKMKMNIKDEIVLFDDALEHLTRLNRTLKLTKGHCLLVGIGGCGKKTLTRFCAYTLNYKVYEITLTRGYDEMSFKDDLKQLYNMIGIENEKVVFLLSDNQIIDESFLEYINNILSNGFIPTLFNANEKENIVMQMRDDINEQDVNHNSNSNSNSCGVDDNGVGVIKDREYCWKYFVNRCQNNLHVVLTMSPIGDQLRKRCLNFPGLINNTVIDWFSTWPDQALYSVAHSFLKDEKDIDKNENKKCLLNDIVEHMVYVHNKIQEYSKKYYDELKRYNYVTPKNYLDFIYNYKNGLEEKKIELMKMKDRLRGGLAKLIEASEEVDRMQKELSEAKIVVEEATIECNNLLEVVHFILQLTCCSVVVVVVVQ